MMGEYSKDDVIDFLEERVYSLQKEIERCNTIMLQMEEELKLHNQLDKFEEQIVGIDDGIYQNHNI